MAKIYPGLTQNAAQILSAFPAEGDAHTWLARAAGCVKPTLKTPELVYDFLKRACGYITHRDIPDREIEAAVDLVFTDNPGQPQLHSKITWPSVRPDAQEQALKAEAMFTLQRKGIRPGDVWGRLFRPGDLVCFSMDTYTATILPSDQAKDIAEKQQFICANPMMDYSATRRTGGVSVRCKDNVSHRRHLVVEFDNEPDLKKQARYLSWLAQWARLTLVTFSGSKSLHGWFNVEKQTTRQRAAFYALACTLGADPVLWNPAAWVRMPGGVRDNNKRQVILHAEGK